LNCWIAMAVTLCAWHVPTVFDLALRFPAWHMIEHACFLGASFLFWWPVVRPFPADRSGRFGRYRFICSRRIC
jgi:cytochrome c oxidase assembly factor CtaG